MAKYRCIPNYEYIRPGIRAKFDIDGNYETNEAHIIKELDEVTKKSPFITKVEEKETETPKPKAQPKKPAQSKRKSQTKK